MWSKLSDIDLLVKKNKIIKFGSIRAEVVLYTEMWNPEFWLPLETTREKYEVNNGLITAKVAFKSTCNQ